MPASDSGASRRILYNRADGRRDAPAFPRGHGLPHLQDADSRMTASTAQPLVFHPHRSEGGLAARLARAVAGDVLFDAGSRGRYATDASIYQIEPVGVLVPKTVDDVRAAIAICRELGVPVLARGAGSSQCGQTVGAALVIDCSKHLARIGAFDRDAMTVAVEPGVVLDQLNAWLKPHGLWFPVDVSTSAQATLGGMAGNNSCGSRSIAYGNMVHNVLAIDAILSDGTEARFGPESEMEARAAARRRAPARAAGDRRARARRDRAQRAQGAAPRRRLQHRRLLPAERAAVHRRWPRQLRASPRRQRRHARVDARAHAAARAAARASHARRRQFPDAVSGDGVRAPPGRAPARRRSSSSTGR